MTFASWLCLLKPFFARTRQMRRSQKPAAFARPQRLRLEALEDRIVPSTITVTNTNDSGDGSLRAAIAQAAPGDTIDFSSTLQGQTITLTSGELSIAKDLTISGLGAKSLAISGGSSSRIFDVAAGSTVSISGLTIEDGLSRNEGGGIFNGGNLTLGSVVLSGNRAIGTFGSNGTSASRNGGNGGTAEGGAIYNSGSLTVSSATLASNQALGGRGGYGYGSGSGGVGGAGLGGGIYSAGGSLSLNKDTLSSNQARGGPGGSGGSWGFIFGVFIQGQDGGSGGNGGIGTGGGFDSVSTALTFSQDTFSANGASGGAGGDGGSAFIISTTVVGQGGNPGVSDYVRCQAFFGQTEFVRSW